MKKNRENGRKTLYFPPAQGVYCLNRRFGRRRGRLKISPKLSNASRLPRSC
ncbi:MAG: hypothetical protein IJ387_08155 [Thermoguttaceae bacterium]|nr:hypothetical protein [Thermoguttaceae bacterium]